MMPSVFRPLFRSNFRGVGEKGDDVIPTAFFNGLDTLGQTYTGGPSVVADNLGVLNTIPVDTPAISNARYSGGVFSDTDASGTPLWNSVSQRTRVGAADFSSFTAGPSFKNYLKANPSLDPALLPGQLFEPSRTNYALNSATPATHTTGSIAVGTYILWQEGTGSVTATAGTAVGTFGAASNGTPATITITTAGTVVLTCAGSNTWVQLELGAYKTGRIATLAGSVTRAATVVKYNTAGIIRPNDMAFRIMCSPSASGQTNVRLFSTYTDASNYLSIHLYNNSVTIRKMVGGSVIDSVATPVSNGKPLDIVAVVTITGMRIAVRYYDGGWTSFVQSSLNADGTDAVIGSTYQVGSMSSAYQFAGKIHHFDTRFIPSNVTDPLTWAKKEFGVA